MSTYIKELPADALEFQMFVLDEMADKLAAEGKDVIKVTIGISELPIPPRVLDVLVKTIQDHDKTHVVYPEGLPALREAVARYYSTKYGAGVSAADIIINTGTSPIFRNLFQLICSPGSEILLPRPYYCLYLVSALLADARITFYDINPTTGRVDMDSFWEAYDKDRTAAVVINNPGNPLGNVLTRAEVENIYKVVDGNSFVVNDEMYNNTCFYEEFACPLSYVSERDRAITIVTNGFSKGYRMYTKRVGYALLPKQLQMPMRIVQQHTLLTGDPVNQHGMIEALKDEDSPKELTDLYRVRAEYTTSQLTGTGCAPLKAEGGFYAVLECSDWIKQKGFASSKELAKDILESVHVSTVPGTDFGIPNCLRLSFCQSRYLEAIDRLKTYFEGSPRASVTTSRTKEKTAA
jgi:aspartate/methionine/tyrosine aminotransferase